MSDIVVQRSFLHYPQILGFLFKRNNNLIA